ncbi:hypothetical protein ISN76_02485 [Dyella halodurans]|uniref:Uncharacterized protein n=1 Tax=Dyella halodurans TaxID=1920171 RepID=A0ABV9BWP6_9GAMM|nr:hypothetical protein [Dyella halodurans]
MKISIFVILLAFSIESFAQGCVPARIELTGKGATDQSGTLLKFSMKYLGCEPLRVQRESLPWGARGAIGLTVIENNGLQTPLEQLGYISDPDSDDIELIPGKEYSGAIGLSTRFRDIDSARLASGVTVSWVYTLQSRTGVVIGPVQGSVVIGGSNDQNRGQSAPSLKVDTDASFGR